MPDRTRLVVLFGGRSAEHEVSCMSAVSVLSVTDPDRYQVVPVGVTRQGEWVLAGESARSVLAAAASGADPTLPRALEAVGPRVDPLAVVEGAVVLPLLHGPFGEDGTVQGLCEVAGVAYAGSGVLGSALAMDKILTKQVLAHDGIPVAAYVAHRRHVPTELLTDRVERQLGWPVFVKPANLGSSIGVSKVAAVVQLEPAVEAALAYDDWVLVEEAVPGREIECGVLEEPGGGGEARASVPGEIRPAREFYDYEDKYVDGRAELLVPAPLPASVVSEVQRLALATFAAVRAEGMARVDFFYDEDGDRLLVNEVNTIPGFTPISMFPKVWDASGVTYRQLIDRLVGLALERHARRSGRATGPER